MLSRLLEQIALALEDVRGMLLKNPSCRAAYIREWLQEFDRSLSGGYVQKFEELTHSLEGGR